MQRFGTWLIGISLVIAMAVVVVAVTDTPETVGDTEAFEEALTAALPARPQAPEQARPSDSGAQPVIPAAQPAAPDYPVQDSSIESLQRRSARPIWIRIDSIDVAHEVNGYGIDSRTGQMDVPNNVGEVAWYEFGPSPGEPGSAVLAAHVDLASRGPGVFYSLRDIDEGALIIVGFDDGSTQRFEVQARTTYLKDELPLDAIFSRTGPSVLTLITCGGGFNQSVSSYDSNVVAYAVPIDDPGTAS